MLKAILKMFFWLVVRFLKTFKGLFSIAWFFTKRFAIGLLVLMVVAILGIFRKKG